MKAYELHIDLNRNTIYLVMELVDGKEMFEVIHDLGYYNEEDSKKLFR